MSKNLVETSFNGYVNVKIWQDIFSLACESYSIDSAQTLDNWFASQDDNYSAIAIKSDQCVLPIVMLNEQLIGIDEWFNYKLKANDEIKIFVEPAGDPVTWFYIVTLAFAVYTYATMPSIDIPNNYNAQRDTSGTYNINAQGNRARLGSPATLPCGDFAFYPEFASEPWSDYDNDNNQWLYQMFGWAGKSQMLGIDIGNTPIDNYRDDIVSQYYAPGELVDLFPVDVETSLEVGGNDGSAGIQLDRDSIHAPSFNSVIIGVGDDVVAINSSNFVMGADITLWALPVAPDQKFSITDSSPLIVNTIALTGVSFLGDAISGGNLAVLDFRVGSKITIIGSSNDGEYRVGRVSQNEIGVANMNFEAVSFQAESNINIGIEQSDQSIDGIYLYDADVTSITFRLVQIDTLGQSFTPIFPAGEWACVLKQVYTEGFGFWTIPYYACRRGTTTNHLKYDISFPNGLIEYLNGGAEQSVNVQLEWRARNVDTGEVSIYTASITAKESVPYHRSYDHQLPSEGVWVVACRRVSLASTSAQVRDTVEWTSLKAVYNTVAVFDDFSILCLKIKATNSLSSLAERKCRVKQVSIRSVYDESTSSWIDAATSNPAWIIADALCNDVWGDGRDRDKVIDLPSFINFAKACDARNDRFRGLFDTRTKIQSAIKRIAAVGRATVDQRGNVFHIVRDSLQFIPQYPIGQSTIKKGSFEYSTQFETSERIDGLRVIYTDSRTWKDDEIQLRLPGQTGNNLEDLRLYGVADKRQAVRNGLSYLSQRSNRHTSVKLKTENFGRILHYNALCSVSHPLANWGQSGRVRFKSGLNLVLTKQLDWVDGQPHFIVFRAPNGKRSQEILVTAGSATNELILSVEPDVELITIDDTEGRFMAEYQFGCGDNWYGKCLVQKVSIAKENETTVTLVQDSDKAYQFDILETQVELWSDNNDAIVLAVSHEYNTQYLVSWMPITTVLSGYLIAQGSVSEFDPAGDYIDIDTCCHKVLDTSNGAWVKVAAYSAPDYDPAELVWVEIQMV